MDPQAICIMGMHRSGTSALAGALYHMGVDLGDDLLGSHERNPLGHFESRRFMELNNRILEQSGGSWDNPPSRIEASLALREEMRDLLSYRIGSSNGVWGWKDPRNCLTFEVWKEILDELGVSVFVVVSVRSMDEVDRSLKKAYGTLSRSGEDLWSVYYESVARVPRETRIGVWYPSLAKDPETVLGLVADRLGLPVGVDLAVGFVRDNLYRNRVEEGRDSCSSRERDLIEELVTYG